MKKEHALIFVVIAFIAGFVAGVVVAVYQGENFSSIPSSPKPSSLGPSPPALSEAAQNQIRSLQALLKEDPKNLKALVEIGNLYFDADQFDGAINYYAQALQIDPRNADVRTDLGIMFRRKGETDKAIAEFKKAAEIDPRHANSRYNLGVVLLHDKKDIKGAIQAWEDYLKVDPDSPRAEKIRFQISKMKGMIQ
jgi:tetratricopeptide (TPR) repeat protein